MKDESLFNGILGCFSWNACRYYLLAIYFPGYAYITELFSEHPKITHVFARISNKVDELILLR